MTNEGKGETEKWIADKGAKYAYGYDKGGKFKSKCGVTGIPHAFLVDPSGKIVWRGHPGNLNDGIIQSALGGALKKPLWELPKEYAKVKIAIAKGDLATAVRESRALAGAPTPPPDAATVADAISNMVTGSLTAAEGLAKAGDYLGAQRDYQRLAKALAGLPEARTAQTALDDMKKNPDAMKGIKAQLELEKALQMPDKKAADRASLREALESIKKTYPGTFAASEADKAIASLTAKR